MGNLLEAVRRIRASIKLEHGKCGWCRKILPDDATGYCSGECLSEARYDANQY